MVDGNLLWDDQVTNGMVPKYFKTGKECHTYSELPANLYEALKSCAAVHPNKKAIVDDDGTAYGYKEVLLLSEELAAYLYHEKSVKKGGRVALMMHNSIEFCVAFLALVRLGAVCVPLPSKFRRFEVRALAEHAEVGLIICEMEYRQWFCEMLSAEKIVCVEKVGQVGKSGHGFENVYSKWKTRTRDVCDLVSVETGNMEDDVILMFTSGTTSKSKGVILKNYNVAHAVESYRRILSIQETDISVIATPIYHITGLVALLGLFLSVGGTLYLHRTFDAGRMVEDAARFGFTFIHASPTVFHLILKERARVPSLPDLKKFACGSGNMMKEKILQLHDWIPDSKFYTVYGLTETTSPATIFPGDAAISEFIGSSGLPIPGIRFKIVDDNHEELPCGQVGEIAICGSVVTEGYYKKTTADLQDGWLYTGDLGYFNENNYLYIVDRKKDMINRGGEKIWCYDVENELASIPGVLDAAVVGIPDELYGEVAAAVVEISDTCVKTVEEIQTYMEKHMAGYKVPVRIKTVDKIPQTVNGKTDKAAVRKMLMED